MSTHPKLAVIAGATASGKSALAMELAERTDGVIVNADASQLYRDLRILSARPSVNDEACAEHRLYGIIDGANACSAAAWAKLARAEVERIAGEGRLPILTGGSGLYIGTLLDGIAPIPEIDSGVRDEVRRLATPEARAALEREDPAAAARLGVADRTRIQRALEVIRSTGRSLVSWHEEPAGGLSDRFNIDAQVVELSRDTLYARIDSRFDAMIADGALGEVEALRDRQLSPELPVMKALGVPPLLRHLAGELTLDEARARAQRDTRHYAKRQLTWFRNQTPGWTRVLAAG